MEMEEFSAATLFGGRDDGSPFLVLPRWKAASPVYVVTDAVTTATRADEIGDVWTHESHLINCKLQCGQSV